MKFNIVILLFFAILSSSKLQYDGRGFHSVNRDSLSAVVVFSIDTTGYLNEKSNVNLYYHDSLGYGTPVLIPNSGTKLTLTASTLLFEPNDKQIPFLIHPGESLILKYAGTDSLKMVAPGNSERTNELDFFRQLVVLTGNIYYTPWTLVKFHQPVKTLEDLRMLENRICDIKDARNKFLNNYVKKNPVSESFHQIASTIIRSTALFDSILLYRSNKVLLDAKNSYKNMIAKKLTSLKNLPFIPYQPYYRLCNTFVNLSTGYVSESRILNNVDLAKKSKFIIENFSGQTKDFLLASALYQAYDNNIVISPKQVLYLNQRITSSNYRRLINSKLNLRNTYEHTEGTDNLLLADGKTIEKMEVILSKYSGKITLIDFWASWCVPCRTEIRYIEILKKKYANRLVVVSISSDTKIDAWLRASEEESLEKDKNFLLLNAEKSAIVKKLKINSIPRYIVIGKDGKIISENAPRPSDPNLRKLIEGNL